MAKAATLIDPLTATSVNGTLWGGQYGTLSESSAGLLITNPVSYTGYGGFESVSRYDLTGSQFSARLVDAGNQAVNSWEIAPVHARLDGSNILGYLLNKNGMFVEITAAGATSHPASLSYNPAVHKHFRVREAGGTIFWDWSTDGFSWTNLYSVAAPFAVTALQGGLAAGTYSLEATATSVTIDSFGGPIPSLAVTAAGLGAATATVRTGANIVPVAAAIAATTATVRPPTAKAAALIDPLTAASINATLWGGFYGTLSESSGGLLITNPISTAGYGGMDSVASYDLTASQFSSRLVNGGNQALTSLEVVPVRAYLDTNNFLAWYLNGGTLRSQVKVGGVNSFPNSLTYSAAVHKYFRLREAGGTIFWDWSTDGVTWTNLSTLATPFAITALQGGLNSGTYSAEASATSTTMDSFGGPIPSLAATAAAIGVATATVKNGIPNIVPVATAVAATTATVRAPSLVPSQAAAIAAVSAGLSAPAKLTATASAVGVASTVTTAPAAIAASATAVSVVTTSTTAPSRLTPAATALAAVTMVVTVPGIAFLPSPTATGVAGASAVVTAITAMAPTATAVAAAALTVSVPSAALLVPTATALAAAAAAVTAVTLVPQLLTPAAQALAQAQLTVRTTAAMAGSATAIAAASMSVGTPKALFFPHLGLVFDANPLTVTVTATRPRVVAVRI